MQYRSLISRINDYLASMQPSDKPNLNPSSMAEEILEKFRSDEDFNRRIISVINRFSAEELDVVAYLKAVLRHQSLFLQSPETIEGNIRGLDARFREDGLDTASSEDRPLRKQSSI